MKKVFKKKIIITGGKGLLGSNFRQRYRNKYRIINYPYRIENFNRFEKWIENKIFDYFIHFAALTQNADLKKKDKFKIINTNSSIKLLEILNKKTKHLKYFLFISSSHIYGFSKKKISENYKRVPSSPYGISKKKVEDYIIINKNNFYFKTGIARIFNTTGKNQKRGFFIPDMVDKIRFNILIKDINKFRDFIHLDDVLRSIELILRKKVEYPINVCSGKKYNLVHICKIISSIYLRNIPFRYNKKRGKDLFGSNSLIKKLGIRKFKNIYQIIKSFN